MGGTGNAAWLGICPLFTGLAAEGFVCQLRAITPKETRDNSAAEKKKRRSGSCAFLLAERVRDALPAEAVERNVRQGGRAFQANGIESSGVESESAEDGGRDLVGADSRGDKRGVKRRIDDQKHDICVVVGEAAVLHKLCLASCIRDAYVGGDDDVRRAWIFSAPQTRFVVIERERRTEEELPEADGRGVLLQDVDGGLGLRWALQPEEGNVVFCGADAGGIEGRL